jgi:hypothetical protein
MGEWLLANSMRYTSFTVVEVSMMHVIEFHRGYLGVSPPPFTWSRWLLKKLELCMAKENPEGRRRRPGLTSADVTLICDRVWDWVNNDLIPLGRRRFYVNCGAAIAATFTPALRTGETCPGVSWNSRDYWSRQHIGRMLDASVLAQPGVESVLVKAMKRKTVYKNAAARQKSTQPILYDAKASQSFSLALWGPKLQDLDPCKFGQELDTPAFRTGGPDSPALSVDILREFMRDIAEDVVEDWELHDYGCHSLRIGREAMLRETDARPETINEITAHTSTLGRAPYSRPHHDQVLAAHRQADTATARPLERMVVDASGSTLVTAPGTAAATAATLPTLGGAAQVATGDANIRSHWPGAP